MKSGEYKESIDNFIKVDLIQAKQKGKEFFVGKMPSNVFLDIYTVEPAEYDINKYTSLAAQFKDDEAYYKYLINDDKKHIDIKAFQREESRPRVNEIAQFLKEEEYALFPNSIIVTCSIANDLLDDDNMSFEEFYRLYSKNTEVSNHSFLEKNNGGFSLYIPKIKSTLLLIDGQHRVRGLKESSSEIINNYDLVVSFIIGYDRATVAKLFYTINYTQKSVNKSRLYHLMGEFSRELTEVTFMHEVVKVLNELEPSPFYKRIKMLGVIPKDLPLKDKERLTISQAFLIDNLVPTISISYERSIYQPIFLFYYLEKDYQIEIIRFIIKYFTAISKLLKDDWKNPSLSIVSRTISIGAFIKTMHILFVTLFVDKFKLKPDAIKEISVDFLTKKLEGIQEVDFSRTGEFGGAASEGSLSKLKERIISKASFTKSQDYQSFITIYREDYLPLFKDWIKKNR